MSNTGGEAVAQGEEFKNAANKYFQEGKYEKASEYYDKAIECNPSNAIYYSNRAFANFKLERYGSCIEDAKKCIELDKSFAKGYYRLGSAELALGKYKLALKSFKQVVKLYPQNKEAKDKLQMCEKIVRRIAFEEAIEVKEIPISEEVQALVETMTVDSSHTGVRMEPTLTLENVKQMMQEFKEEKKIHIKYPLRGNIKKALSSLDTLIEIDVPTGHFNVCGDTHGQFYDLLNIFELNGLPSESNPYLFNGDYVDRGSWSFETVLTLFALKLLYPKHMRKSRYTLIGLVINLSESLNMNNIYGFRNEVEAKYNRKVFELFTEVFCWLPLAAVINKKVFVVHGGLFSKDGVTLNDIKAINRVRQPPDEGLFCEMLWSDPQPLNGRAPNKRGVGIAFGPDCTKNFLKDNGLVKEEGYVQCCKFLTIPRYLVEADGKLITVFSAPSNKGAIVKLNTDMTPSFITFTAVPHPNKPPMAYSSQFSSFF